MFQKIQKLILLILACLPASFSFAQTIANINSQNNYRVVHWGVQDGLSQDVVYDMIKGRNGFLWIGTQNNGLNRFDGSSFKKYFADKTKKNKAIAGNNISGLIEDSLYNIWIGTDKGLSCYNNKADSFINFYSHPSNSITPFWATKDEVFCWDHQNNPESELIAYNIHSFTKRTLVKISSGDSVGHSISDRYSIFDARSNSIWLEQGEGGSPGGGLLQVSLSTGRKQRFGWQCYRNIPNHDHSFEGMRYDRKRNAIWISDPDGLVEFTLDDKQFHHVSAFDQFTRLKEYHLWAGISIDTSGRLWIATNPKGIIIYDPIKNSVNLAFPKDSILQANTCVANVLLYCDRDGTTWAGSWVNKGIYQMIPFSQSVLHYIHELKGPHALLSDFIVQCFDAGKGKIWMGTGYGINIFDPATGLFQMLQRKDLPGTKGEGNIIFIDAIDTARQKAWILADDVHYQLDISTKKCIPVILKNDADLKMLPSGINTPYKKTCIITAHYSNRQGIFIVNNDSSVAEKVLSFPAGTLDVFKTATDDSLLFLRQPDSAVNLTYAHHGEKWIRTPNPMDSIHWLKLIYNKVDHTYWLAAEKMIYHYNSHFRLIRTYTQQDGMPDFDVCGMISDNRNNIWFNTESSIHLLDIKTGRITTLSEKDGFQKQGFTPMLNFGKSASGKLYLPGGVLGQGFNFIDPSAYTQTLSSIYLQSLLVNNKPFLLSESIISFPQLVLKHFENKITIETGIIDFYSKGNNRIRYRLGEDADWQYQVSNTIRFEGLAPGDYKLIIQASNASNEFNGPKKILLIEITPPFWDTWWFRILATICSVLLLYAYVQYRSRNLKKQNIALEEKVIHRTGELNKRTDELDNSLAELKATQDQLIQTEKMASLGELTSGIAHEIKNPLNFIKNFSEINMELITEIEEEQIPNLDENNRAEMESIMKTLKINSEKINHHGSRIDGIVKGMLQHSRQGSATKEPVNINALCDDSLKLAYNGFKAKEKTFNASFETRFDPDLPALMAVPQDMGRVLLNLINNAFYAVHEKEKHSRQGLLSNMLEAESLYKPTLIISTKKCENKINITVSDNGMGVPSNIINKIFQPFFTTKPTGEGTGLGLSMSYDIITKGHGGELLVKSKEGLGTDFEILLPIQKN